jgi:hypothetical protein
MTRFSVFKFLSLSYSNVAEPNPSRLPAFISIGNARSEAGIRGVFPQFCVDMTLTESDPPIRLRLFSLDWASCLHDKKDAWPLSGGKRDARKYNIIGGDNGGICDCIDPNSPPTLTPARFENKYIPALTFSAPPPLFCRF